MKKVLLIFALMIFYQASFAQKISETDSLEITRKIGDWYEGWENKDVELTCKWYSQDADFTNAFGFNMIGKLNIQEYLTEVFGFDFVMSGKTVQTSIKFKPVSDKAILVITTSERKGQETSDNKDIGTRNTTHYRLFEKNGEWVITAHLISDARSTESEKH